MAPIKPASAKAKGRRFQQAVRAMLIKYLGLDPTDVESRPMGSQGEDIIIGAQSRRVFPYSIETKHRKSMKEVYTAYQQAVDNCPEGAEPLYVVRTDYQRHPLVLLDFAHFLKVLDKLDEYKQTVEDLEGMDNGS